MATFDKGWWATGYKLPPGQTHHWFQDQPRALMQWFVAQPRQQPFDSDSHPEQALEVSVLYLKKANSNDLQVNVLVQNVGTNTAYAYDIFYASAI